jgi:hypothetical protein
VGADGARSLGLAVSKDGASWRRYGAPVLTPASEPGAWDGGAVGAPCGVSMSAGRWRLYYAGRASQTDGARGVGA